MTKTNILITGPPRCGKTTLIRKVVGRIERPATGFYTLEIREKGRRVGFSINTLDGREGILAHEDIKSQLRVGKYGVNLKDIDSLAVPAMIPARKGEIVVIDEIGKMECFSWLFKETLIRVLGSSNRMIGSIAEKGDHFIQRIKQRDDVMVIMITTQNRVGLVDQLLDSLKTQYQSNTD
ncbi:Nucleoside-triphosphatase THEP1 [subsurface metagenome]